MLLAHLYHHRSDLFTLTLREINSELLEASSVLAYFATGVLNYETEDAEMSLIGEVSGLPYLLPPLCKLRSKFRRE